MCVCVCILLTHHLHLISAHTTVQNSLPDWHAIPRRMLRHFLCGQHHRVEQALVHRRALRHAHGVGSAVVWRVAAACLFRRLPRLQEGRAYCACADQPHPSSDPPAGCLLGQCNFRALLPYIASSYHAFLCYRWLWTPF